MISSKLPWLFKRGKTIITHPLTIFLLFLFMFGVRLIHLPADPACISWSKGPFSDVGVYVSNARAKVLFGSWELDNNWNTLYTSPIFTFLIYLSFSLLGVGFVQVRIVSIFFSALTLILFYLLIKEGIDKKSAILSSVFLGLNFVFIMYNRIGKMETTMIFFLVLTLFLFQKGTKHNFFYLLSGMSCLGAVLVKSAAMFFIPVCLLAFVFLFIRSKKGNLAEMGRSFKYFGLGLLIAAFLGISYFFYLGSSGLAPLSSGVFTLQRTALFVLPRSFKELLSYLSDLSFLKTNFFGRMPIISLLAFIYSLWLLCNLKRIQLLEFFTLNWLIIGALLISVLRYSPLRYRLFLIPPMCILAAQALFKLGAISSIKIPKKFTLQSLIILFLGLNILSYSVIWTFFNSLLNRQLPTTLSFAVPLSISFLGTFLIVILCKGWPFKSIIQLPKVSREIVIIFLIILSLSANMYQYWGWAKSPHYSLISISQDLGSRLNDAVIYGGWAPELCLENKHHVLYSVNPEKIREYGVVHLLLEKGNEESFLFEKYPELRKKAIFIKEYKIEQINVTLNLYQFG